MTTDIDQSYLTALSSSSLANKLYMMPVSPWFFRHFGPSSYSFDNSHLRG